MSFIFTWETMRTHTPFNPQLSNMFLIVIFCILLTQVSCVDFEEGRTVFGKLKSGFQWAGKLLGIDHASGVAQLVTQAFGKTHRKGENGNSNIFSGFLRVLGFDTKKIGAIAVNAIIFVAQLISSSLSRPLVSSARKVRSGSPFDWMMNLTGVVEMIEHVKDKELPNQIVMHIKEKSLDEETDCVQLLVCKSAPFVWGMQRAISNKENVTGQKSLFAYLPSVDEVVEHADGNFILQMLALNHGKVRVCFGIGRFSGRTGFGACISCRIKASSHYRDNNT